MKFLAALFIIVTTPILVFFATIVYNGTSHTTLKHELTKTNMYEKLAVSLKNTLGGSEEESSEDPNSSIFATVIQKRLTKEYIQGKTETFIDDTSQWVQNKTTTPPVISFREIKEDLISQNPEMAAQINQAVEDMKKQQNDQSGTGVPEKDIPQDSESHDNELKTIQALMKNDFSIPVGKNIAALKQAYQIFQIALPVLAVLIILSLIALFALTKNVSSRLYWLTSTLTISALYGFLVIFLYDTLFSLFEKLILGYSNEWMTIITPLMTTLLTLFGEQYKHNQTIISCAFLGAGVLYFVLTFILKPQKAKKLPIAKKK